MKKLRTYGHLDENGKPLGPEHNHKLKVNEFKIRKLKQECKEELELKRASEMKKNLTCFLEFYRG